MRESSWPLEKGKATTNLEKTMNLMREEGMPEEDAKIVRDGNLA
jgi:hypothetical protein